MQLTVVKNIDCYSTSCSDRTHWDSRITVNSYVCTDFYFDPMLRVTSCYVCGNAMCILPCTFGTILCYFGMMY